MLRASGLVSPARVATLYHWFPFWVRLDKEREEGPANQSWLTLEVEAKHFKNCSFYKRNRTPELPIASYQEKFSLSIDTKQQANSLFNHEIAKFDLQFFFANAN